MSEDPKRALSREEALALRPGDSHYSAYVGPPGQWDVMGATQFRLLTALGLREHHRLLDLGCGALRAGRLFIPYLNPGCYFGLEPNAWLVEDGLSREVGFDMVAKKAPVFRHADDFSADGFGTTFDFIVAQSVFSHTGPELVARALAAAKRALSPGGLLLATFIDPARLPAAPQEAPGWTYPGCTTFTAARIVELVAKAGLVGRVLPWWHPRQTWYAIAHTAADLPPASEDCHLTGGILRDSSMAASLKGVS